MPKLLNVFLATILFFQLSAVDMAMAYERETGKPAIVLAAFGTTEPEALISILNIKSRVEEAFPSYDVKLAFTSNIIRNIWHKRAGDGKFKKENPKIPADFYQIGNVLSELAKIQEDGGRLVLVQSLHIADGEEYQDVANLVKSLAEIKTFQPSLHPFPWIGIGEPALGVGDGQEEYLKRAAKALAPICQEAVNKKAALVLMGHGNEHIAQKVYGRFQQILRSTYGPQIYIGTVEAFPKAEDVVEALDKSNEKPSSVILAPLMVVAGDHARNDMAGPEDDSWASQLSAKGFKVDSRLSGLGSNDSWADIYVEHLKVQETKVSAIKDKAAK